MIEKDEHRYDDIIDLPHHTSKKHPRMPLLDRAAQFAPFAALTGHEAAIKETARLTEEEIELDENRKELLDLRLQQLQECLAEQPMVTVTYFKPDEKKAGGAYVSVTGVVLFVAHRRKMIMKPAPFQLPRERVGNTVYFNPGVISAILVCTLLMVYMLVA